MDLVIVSGIVWLLLRWLWLDGASRAWRAWSAVALFLFYFSTSEWCHCQRDTWMLLPCLAALHLRRRQTKRLSRHAGGVFGWAMLEGLLWGAALWIKPHAAVMGGVAWLFGTAVLWRHGQAHRQEIGVDLLGMLSSGIVIGAAGVAWLWRSGAWPYFIEILAVWNQEYLTSSGSSRWNWDRFVLFLDYFIPWFFIHAFAVPLALIHLFRAFRRGSASGVLLPAMYLAWLAQSWLMQLPLHYNQVPPIFLGMAVLLSQDWGMRFNAWAGWGMAVLLLAGMAFFPYFQQDRYRLWGRCIGERSNPDLWDRLAHMPQRAHWGSQERILRYLRQFDLQDRELSCWHAQTINLYKELDIRPSTRFVYMDVAYAIFRSRRKELQREIEACPHRYLVYDLIPARLTLEEAQALGPEGDLDGPLPMPERLQSKFPWNQHAVYRYGRYVVCRMDKPIQWDPPDK